MGSRQLAPGVDFLSVDLCASRLGGTLRALGLVCPRKIGRKTRNIMSNLNSSTAKKSLALFEKICCAGTGKVIDMAGRTK